MLTLSISENILRFLSGFGIAQAILLAFILVFHPKSDLSVNKFLALYIISLTVPPIVPVVQYLYSWRAIVFVEPFLTLIPAFLFLYVRSFKEVITWKKAWPHFIFFVASSIYALWEYKVEVIKFPATVQIPPEAVGHWLLLVPMSARLVQRITYFILSRRELASYQRSILHLYSDTSQINLNWVRWMINGFLFLVIMTMVFYPLILRYPEQFSYWILIHALATSVYIYLATFKGITQLTLWKINSGIGKEKVEEVLDMASHMDHSDGSKPKEVSDSVIPITEKTKSRKSGLSEGRVNEIVERITYLMTEEKLYQEPELTLQQLADKLEIPSHHLSQTINDGMKKNFYDLVNNYRVEEAKRLLLDPKNRNYTILSVGFEAGFNSKTTFNTVFKKFTGLTPTEYRVEQKSMSVVA